MGEFKETKTTSAMDQSTFALLHKSFNEDLWSFLRHRMQSQADAEDLLQEIWLKIYRAWSDLEQPERARSWVFAIALNTVRSFHRGTRPVQLAREDEMHDRPDNQPGPYTRLEARQRMEHLQKALAELSEREREIVLLESMGGLDQSAIATLMDVNINTLKTLLRRARIKLAAKMVEVTHA